MKNGRLKYDFEKLKDARERQMLTKTEVARRAGVTVATVHYVESGKAPWLTAIRKIASVLEVRNVIKPRRRTA